MLGLGVTLAIDTEALYTGVQLRLAADSTVYAVDVCGPSILKPLGAYMRHQFTMLFVLSILMAR
jgi:hypothetical protein